MMLRCHVTQKDDVKKFSRKKKKLTLLICFTTGGSPVFIFPFLISFPPPPPLFSFLLPSPSFFPSLLLSFFPPILYRLTPTHSPQTPFLLLSLIHFREISTIHFLLLLLFCLRFLPPSYPLRFSRLASTLPPLPLPFPPCNQNKK